MAVLRKLGKIQLSLSSKLILSMAGLVILSAVTSLLISNIIIHNQTRQLEQSLQRFSTQVQEVRKQNAQPASVTLDQIKQIVNNTDDATTPEATLQQINRTLRNSEGLTGVAFMRFVRDSGFPASDPICLLRPGPSGGADTNVIVANKDQAGGPKGSPPGRGDERCAPNNMDAIYNYPLGQAIGLGSLFSALCAVAVGFVLSRRIIRPLRALEQASERIVDGNYNHEIKLGGNDEIAKLANSFNRMAQALRLTEQKRKDLVADVSHELRTPLSSIQGYTEVLRDGLVPSRERQEEILGHVLKEVKHLTTMVNSMRAWVNNEQELEHLDVEAIPARYVAEMVLERFQPAATAKGVTLKLEIEQPEPQVLADTDALSHALSNLVDNALRYTPSGGTVVIKVGQTLKTRNDKSPQVSFEVSDTGIGIAPEHLPFIFERFYRVDKSRDRNTGGSGLGLAIVRDTVHALGGDVKIKSTPEQGTCVHFSLPGVRPAPAPRKRRTAALKTG